MKLSTNQIERLADRVYRVLRASNYICIEENDEKAEDRIADVILTVLDDDSRMEERLSREAERLVNQQSQVAKSSNKSISDLVDEVKIRLAKSKHVLIDDGPDRADALAEKIVRQLWKIDCVDFYTEDVKLQNCIAKAIFRFRIEDDRLVEAVEKLTMKKSEEVPYSTKWCLLFDKYLQEVKIKLQNSANSVQNTTSNV